MDEKPSQEICFFIRDERTGRFLFNDRALSALGLDPAQLRQCGYPVSVSHSTDATVATDQNHAT